MSRLDPLCVENPAAENTRAERRRLNPARALNSTRPPQLRCLGQPVQVLELLPLHARSTSVPAPTLATRFLARLHRLAAASSIGLRAGGHGHGIRRVVG